MANKSEGITRERLIDLLNQDLAREFQAVIAYVVYSQVLKGAQYMSIAKELEVHAGEDVGESRRDAAVRPRQRSRDDQQLPRARRSVRVARRIRDGRGNPRDPA